MRKLLAFLTLTAALLAAAPAQASDQQLSIMQDDDLLIYRGEAERDSTLRRMLAIGVDTVRVNVLWSSIARNMRARACTKAADPKAYPAGNWDPIDKLVGDAQALNMRVYFTVTGPGPRCAHQNSPSRKDQATYKPKPRTYAKFVQAVGKRYRGGYIDENSGLTLGRVDIWSLWNEPNQGGWLTPQWEKGRPASPKLYKKLFDAGRKSLTRTGHNDDLIMIGETAPLGTNAKTSRSPMRPGTFLSALARSGGPVLRGNAFAHHPYTKKRSPLQPEANPNDITFASMAGLPERLDGYGGRIPRGLTVMSTEFGYETTPDDPFNGISQEQAAEFMNIGDYIAYSTPRIAGNTQFLFRDAGLVRGGGRRAYFSYQSGLFDRDETPKLTLPAYGLPLVVVPQGGTVSVWGQLRFRFFKFNPNASDQVQMQHRPQGGGDYTNVGGPIPVNNAKGFFTSTLPNPGPGVWRATWSNPNEPPFVFSSREAIVSG